MDKVLFITGSSRGIGRAIALKFAAEKACIVIAAKTDKPHPQLEGTIHSVAKEVEQLGGHALPLVLDVRYEEQIQEAIAKTVATFGKLDVLINNASAISLTNTESTPMKRYDHVRQSMHGQLLPVRKPQFRVFAAQLIHIF